MKLSTLSVLSSLILAAAPAVAQAPDTSPAKEVKKFEKLIGTWEGTGTVTHGPGIPTEKWTSRSSCKWALSGHFVREDVRIEVPSQTNPLEFINLYGWDRENERYVQIEINNMGVGRLNEVHFTDNGKMITVTGERRHVIALNPDNGELIWSFTEPNTHRHDYSMRTSTQ